MDPSSLILPSSVAPSLHGSMISEWTGPWSDGSICLLKNIPSLTGWLRVINVVGHVASIQWLITSNKVSLRLPCRSFYINLSLVLEGEAFTKSLTSLKVRLVALAYITHVCIGNCGA